MSKWTNRKEWRCPKCMNGGTRGCEDLHAIFKCDGRPHEPSCSAFFARDPNTGVPLCDCGAIVREIDEAHEMSTSEKDREAAIEAARNVLNDAGMSWLALNDKRTLGDHQVGAVAEAIATARAEGYRAGLERAAKECDDRAVLNESVEGGPQDIIEAACRAVEARECAFAIRALADAGEDA